MSSLNFERAETESKNVNFEIYLFTNFGFNKLAIDKDLNNADFHIISTNIIIKLF